jgi:asparagine synthase (glutamine-hydrolysing)
MCGIAGSRGVGTDEPVRRMVSRLTHRGPDGSGVITADGVTLGHTRLAILDVEAGRQPMQYGQYWISYNGEVYNHRDLRARHFPERTFRTRSDTETVLRLYARYGPSCVELLDGMFAFAVADEGEVFLARDPYGIKPLYYGERDGVFYFASEIKALAQLTRDIREFPAGHWYHSSFGLSRYRARVGAARLDKISSPEQALPVIRDVLGDAVQKRLMSDVPLGVSLSGGLDSSIIAVLARATLDRLDSFAVGMTGSADLAYAREAAEFLGTRHHEYVYTERDITEALPDILFYLESFDPALVRSAVANYFLARLASDRVKVILGGEGADELYAGYAYLRGMTQARQLQSELVAITDGLHNTNLQRTDRMSMAFGLEMRVPFLDVASVRLALSLPAAWKIPRPGRQEKALLRCAFADELPAGVVNRPKQKYSQGAGSAGVIAAVADLCVSDADFAAERARLWCEWRFRLANKEALYYYRILRRYYADACIFPTLGVSRSL